MRSRYESGHLTIFTISLLLAALPCLGQPAASEENEPLSPGQNRLGVYVQTDGKILFHGEELGQIRDAGAAQARLSAPSPKRGLIYVNHADTDWGGLQGSIVDPAQGRVIVKSMLPDERIRGRGAAEGVVQVCEPISWSPEEDYALTVECGEVVSSVVLADLANGVSRIIEVGNFENDKCDWQQFSMDGSTWVSPTVYKLKVMLQENPWAEQPCAKDREYPEYNLYVDARTLEVRPVEGAAPPPQPAGLVPTQSKSAETSAPEASAPPLPSVGLVRTTSRLNLRECPAAEGCGVIRTLAAGIDLEVLGQQEEWLQVRDAAAGDSGWVHSSYTTGVATPPYATPSLLSRMISLHPAIAMLILAFPFLIGTSVWLIKPVSALTRMDAWNNWLLHRREKASSSAGFFGRYWGRPVFGLSELLVRWTEQIGDPFLRCGTRVAVFIYVAAFVLIATLLLAYLAVVIVVAIVAIVVTLWIVAKLLSSDEDDSPRRSSQGREQASQEEDEEEMRRELLLRAGARKGKVFQKTGVFAEDEHGRVDEHGRIYRKTGVFSEEQVGRIDEEGRVFTKTGPFSEENVGRIAEDGYVFEKSGAFSEDRIGRIDEDGRIHRTTGPFSEEEIGRADGKT
jgi:hypothetical protein